MKHDLASAFLSLPLAGRLVSGTDRASLSGWNRPLKVVCGPGPMIVPKRTSPFFSLRFSIGDEAGLF